MTKNQELITAQPSTLLTRLFVSVATVLFILLLASCSDDDDVETSTMIVEIDSESNLFHDNTGSLEPGMWVREEGKKNWEKWPQYRIEGFSFEEGYYTKLQIIKKIDHNYDGYDGGSSTSYQLQKILEKKPSESIRNK